PAHYTALSAAQIEALPPRWCLMRNASLSQAGWVAQRFITPDDAIALPAPSAADDGLASAGDAVIARAVSMVRALYEANERFERGQGPDPLPGPSAAAYFTSDIMALMQSGAIGAHPLHGAQDFDGRVLRIAPDPDPDHPMLRGMITVNVDFTNFGQQQRAVFF